ncbi:MAG: YggS family pyridoxal phosphate-dependent enzyme [Cyanobacteria bacterium KgW148]|nr:YggS family pyridoxal phosphate-dependent enzyme [Cyanobacteria bacterium KgW148]
MVIISASFLMIEANIAQLQQELPPSVTLVAVTKYAPIAAMSTAYRCGIRHFGESKVQATQEKRPQLQELPDVTWHLIGHLQRNKTRQALQLFDWIHSIDRLSLAQELNRLIPLVGKSPKLCLQVKLAPDPDKFGWEPQQLQQELPELLKLNHLQIVGLMTILPQGTKGEDALAIFKRMLPLKADLEQKGLHLPHLSMGMSGDYREAIAAGATIVRIGSKIFT